MNEIINATIAELEPLAAMFDLYRQFYRQSSDISGAKKFLSERVANNDSVIFVAN